MLLVLLPIAAKIKGIPIYRPQMAYEERNVYRFYGPFKIYEKWFDRMVQNVR